VELLGNNTLTVTSPGAGTSAPVAYSVYLPLATNDLIFDAHRGVLWASVPSSADSPLGNSIVSIDPYTGVLESHLWVGSEPAKLAISKDGSAMWIAFRGSPMVRKVNLNTMALTGVQLYFPGGWGSNVYATGLATSPGGPSTVAVAAGSVTIYDDAAPRPNSSSSGASYLAYGATASTLYGFASGLSIFTVDSTGIISTVNLSNSGSNSNDLRYDNARLYLTSGQVLDAGTGNLLGTFAASGPVVPDSSLGRAFVLNGSQVGSPAGQVTAFDVNTFVPLDSFGVSGLDNNYNSPSSIVRWGQDGIAFRTDFGVYVLRSSVVQDLSKTPADVAVTASAPATSTTGASTEVKFDVKNDGPNNVADISLVGTFSEALAVTATAAQGSCTAAQVVRCDLGPLANGASTTVTVTAIPTAAGKMVSSALITSSLPDPKTSNNKASATTSVTGVGYNLTPVLTALSPQSALRGSGTLALAVSGANFTAGSTVNWNGTPLATIFTDSGHLTATVAANLISAIGYAQITVATGSPGGGASGALPFSVFNTVTLDTNGIAFDPFTRKLYATIPSTSTQLMGNSIVPIDPITGKIGKPVFIGSEPTRVTVSDDGKYLYVVLSGANAVRRMSLPDMTAGTQFTTVNPVFNSAFVASDVAVMPGAHDTVATCGYSDGIQVWDVTQNGATPRPLTKALVNDVYEGSVLAWGSPTDLYSNDEGLSPSSFHRFAVGSTSFAETDSTYLDAVDNKITYTGGLVFTDGGGIVDPSPAPPNTPQLVGRLMPVGGGSSAADASINGVFYLDQNNYGVTSRVLSSFDATHQLPTGSVQLDNLNGDAFDLSLWGQDGLAFRTATDFWGNGIGRIVLMRGTFVLPLSQTPNPKPTATALSPATATTPGTNTWVTITGSNFVPGAVALWNGSARTTKFINSGQLRVAIAAADVATPKTVKIKVTNPAPGGGSSASLTFTVK
jgi:sugar lactone lactonase YvrE